MSYRQIKKKIDLLPTVGASSSSSDDDDGGNVAQFVTKSSQARRVVKRKAEGAAAVIAAATVSSATDPQPSSASPSAPSPPGKKQEPKQQSKQQPQNKPEPQQQSAKKTADNKKTPAPKQKAGGKCGGSGSAQQKKKSGAAEDEDDALLRHLEEKKGIVHQPEEDDEVAVDKLQRQQGTGVAYSSSSALPTIDELLTVPHKFATGNFDPRTERIRRFGKESVEKIDTSNSSRRFRFSPFTTPTNTNYWPAFDTFGARLRKLDRPTSSSSSLCSEFVLDVSSEESTRADNSLQAAIDSHDLETLLHVHWKRHPYHIPTLLQVFRTACLMNQTELSKQAIQQSLYTAGILLQSFPEVGSFSTRALNGRASRGNAMILQVIFFAVTESIKTGCARTAFELCRLLLSMDRIDDVEWGWSVIDYVALRSSNFQWLQDLASALRLAGSALPLVLPQLNFGPALAAVYANSKSGVLEQLSAASSSSGDSEAGSEWSRNLAAVADAVIQMPSVAARLAVSVGVAEDKLLRQLSKALDRNPAKSKIADLYCKRNAELWRVGAFPKLLRQAIDIAIQQARAAAGGVDAGEDGGEELVLLVTDMAEALNISMVSDSNATEYTRTLRHYSEQTEDHIMGTAPTPIPGEALFDAGGAGGGRQQVQVRLPDDAPDYVRDALARFEAIFGPLEATELRRIQQEEQVRNGGGDAGVEGAGAGVPIHRILDYYQNLLHERVRQRNAVAVEQQHQPAAAAAAAAAASAIEAPEQQPQQYDTVRNMNDDNLPVARTMQAQQPAAAAAFAATSANDGEPASSAGAGAGAGAGGFFSSVASTAASFFRTMLPGHSLREELLQDEMKRLHIEDPVKLRRERERKFDEDHPLHFAVDDDERRRHNDDDDDDLAGA